MWNNLSEEEIYDLCEYLENKEAYKELTKEESEFLKYINEGNEK